MGRVQSGALLDITQRPRTTLDVYLYKASLSTAKGGLYGVEAPWALMRNLLKVIKENSICENPLVNLVMRQNRTERFSQWDATGFFVVIALGWSHWGPSFE